MNTCDKCGYKVISNLVFENHKKTHAIDVEEKPKEELPAMVRESAVPIISNEITLEFIKPIEVYINGIPYVGKTVTVKDMNIASEIVRIAREAYGPSILV
jgi:hypothetical protein